MLRNESKTSKLGLCCIIFTIYWGSKNLCKWVLRVAAYSLSRKDVLLVNKKMLQCILGCTFFLSLSYPLKKMSAVQRIFKHFLFHEKKDIYCRNNLWAQRETNFVRFKKEDLCTLSFYSEYWGLVSRRAWMKAFRSFSLSFFPSSRCSWRSFGS